MSHNRLRKLPAGLFTLPRLQTLDLEDNQVPSAAHAVKTASAR